MRERSVFMPWLAAILLAATALRVAGITWGLPSSTHYFSYHPDETVVLIASTNIDLLHGQLLPHFYNYGSLQLTLVSIANTLLGRTGPVADLAVAHARWAEYYLTGRFLTALMSICTVALVALLGRRLRGTTAGLVSAALLAITPLHVQQSHWLTVDAPATFWGVLCLYCAVRCLHSAGVALSPLPPLDPVDSPRSELTWLIVASVACGFAVATKYNMALLWLPLLLTAAWLRGTRTRVGAALLVVIVVPFVAFLIGCPGVLLDTARWATDIAFEARHTSSMPGMEFVRTGNGLIYLLSTTLPAALGWPLAITAYVALVISLRVRSRSEIFLLCFVIPYCALLSVATVRFARYAMPILPVLCLLIGRHVPLMVPWVEKIQVRRNVAGAIAAFVCVAAFGRSVVLDLWLVHPDTRDMAYRFVHPAISGGEVIAFPRMPWFGTLPITPYTTLPHPGTWISAFNADPNAPKIAISTPDWDTGPLLAPSVDTVIVSEYDTRDPQRLADPAYISYMHVLAGQFHQSGVFDLFRDQNFATRQSLPHDMSYASPRIVVYTRNTVR